eukprot:6473098-Amphidinium_carterae.1
MTSGFYMGSYSAPVPLRVVLEACTAEIPSRPPPVKSRDTDSKRQKTHRSAEASSSSATHPVACNSSSTSQSDSVIVMNPVVMVRTECTLMLREKVMSRPSCGRQCMKAFGRKRTNG